MNSIQRPLLPVHNQNSRGITKNPAEERHVFTLSFEQVSNSSGTITLRAMGCRLIIQSKILQIIFIRCNLNLYFKLST